MSDGVRFFSPGPLSVFAVLILLGLFILIIPLLILGIIGAAFVRLGFSWFSALAVILLMIIGSLVNIPVHRIRRDVIRISRYNAPDQDTSSHEPRQAWDILITCNLGGTIIPAAISAYLLYQAVGITGTSLWFNVCIGIVMVAGITFVSTRIVPGAGIRVPLLIPGLTALLAGIIFSGGTGLNAAVTALVSGTMGALAGGNIANLFRVSDLEIPEVSIGGAGTFGAVFICCILPALLA